jgi:hypothetical protein
MRRGWFAPAGPSGAMIEEGRRRARRSTHSRRVDPPCLQMDNPSSCLQDYSGRNWNATAFNGPIFNGSTWGLPLNRVLAQYLALPQAFRQAFPRVTNYTGWQRAEPHISARWLVSTNWGLRGRVQPVVCPDARTLSLYSDGPDQCQIGESRHDDLMSDEADTLRACSMLIY